MRIGIGYDIHRFTKGKGFFLGGVYMPFDKSLEGHSDADVLLHAICDALLGAAGKGDLGEHFPDTDPAYKGISSSELLSQVKEIVNEEGYGISYIDSVIIAEAPKISPRKRDMIENIASILEIDPEQVHIKATTSEGIGALGKKEGIAAFAVCLLNRG